MPSSSRLLEITLEDQVPDLRLESSTREFRRSLQGMGLSVTAPITPAPPDSRSVGLAAIGALAVTLKPTVELLTEIVKLVNAWRERHKETRVVRLRAGDRELVIEGAEEGDVAEALRLFNQDG
jgi:hypothetical protein